MPNNIQRILSHEKLVNPALNLELIGKATLKRMKIIMNRIYFYGEHERQKFACIVKTSKHHADQLKLSYFEFSITLQIHRQKTVFDTCLILSYPKWEEN